MAGRRRLAVRVYYGMGLVVGAGLDWALGGEVSAIILEMGRAETGPSFSRFSALGSQWMRSSDKDMWPYGLRG